MKLQDAYFSILIMKLPDAYFPVLIMKLPDAYFSVLIMKLQDAYFSILIMKLPDAYFPVLIMKLPDTYFSAGQGFRTSVRIFNNQPGLIIDANGGSRYSIITPKDKYFLANQEGASSVFLKPLLICQGTHAF
jgi:hypothetical protein